MKTRHIVLSIFAISILLLSACKLSYNNVPTARDVSQSPVGYDTAHLTNGNPTPVYDSLYTITPTWSQAFHWAKQRNNLLWFWVGILIMVVCIGIGIKKFNSGADAVSNLSWFAIAIIIGGPITGGSVDWERWNMDQTITKSQYEQLMQKDGDLHEFWDNVRIK